MDPAILEFIAKKENLDLAGVMNVLNKKSGVYGLSKGLSSDFRDLEEASASGNVYATKALDVFCYHVTKTIGSICGGYERSGRHRVYSRNRENAPIVREAVVKNLEYLGVKLDEEQNQLRGKNTKISAAGLQGGCLRYSDQ